MRQIIVFTFLLLGLCSLAQETEDLLLKLKTPLIKNLINELIDDLQTKDQVLELDIPFDKSFDIKPIPFKKLPGILESYFQNLLDVSFDNGAQLKLAMKNFKIKTKVKIESFEFSTLSSSKLNLKLSVKIDQLQANIDKFRLEEKAILAKSELLKNCNPNQAESPVWGEVDNVQFGDKNLVLEPGILFNTEVAVDFQNGSIELQSMSSNFDEPSMNNIPLIIKPESITTPEVYAWVGSKEDPKCYKIPSKPLKIFVVKILPKVKQSILEGLSKVFSSILPNIINQKIAGVNINKLLQFNIPIKLKRKVDDPELKTQAFNALEKNFFPMQAGLKVTRVGLQKDTLSLGVHYNATLSGDSIKKDFISTNGISTTALDGNSDLALYYSLNIIDPIFQKIKNEIIPQINGVKDIIQFQPGKENNRIFFENGRIFLDLDARVNIAHVLKMAKKINLPLKDYTNVTIPALFEIKTSFKAESQELEFQIIPPSIEELIWDVLSESVNDQIIEPTLEKIDPALQQAKQAQAWIQTKTDPLKQKVKNILYAAKQNLIQLKEITQSGITITTNTLGIEPILEKTKNIHVKLKDYIASKVQNVKDLMEDQVYKQIDKLNNRIQDKASFSLSLEDVAQVGIRINQLEILDKGIIAAKIKIQSFDSIVDILKKKIQPKIEMTSQKDKLQ